MGNKLSSARPSTMWSHSIGTAEVAPSSPRRQSISPLHFTDLLICKGYNVRGFLLWFFTSWLVLPDSNHANLNSRKLATNRQKSQNNNETYLMQKFYVTFLKLFSLMVKGSCNRYRCKNTKRMNSVQWLFIHPTRKIALHGQYIE